MGKERCASSASPVVQQLRLPVRAPTTTRTTAGLRIPVRSPTTTTTTAGLRIRIRIRRHRHATQTMRTRMTTRQWCAIESRIIHKDVHKDVAITVTVKVTVTQPESFSHNRERRLLPESVDRLIHLFLPSIASS